MPSVPLVRVLRSGLEESVHLGDVVAVDEDGRVVAFAGEPDLELFARSSMKPLQATVSLSLSSFDFPDPEVAVMCASHNAEAVHVEAVRSLLGRAGIAESALQCPARRPWDEEAAAIAPESLRVNSDCSGKHGGMLAACVEQRWPLDSYLDPEHPYQQTVFRAVLGATRAEAVRVGVDGCGAPVHALELKQMATIYARLVRPGQMGDLRPHAERVVAAMRAQPYLVAGRNRVDTAMMEVANDVVVKAGAEGLLCAAAMGPGLGVAVKVRDGSSRAAGPAMILALRALDVLDDAQVERLGEFASPPVLGGGRPVGEMAAGFGLSRTRLTRRH
jgi:L-asparaginase II